MENRRGDILCDFLRQGAWSWVATHPDGRISALAGTDTRGFGFLHRVEDGRRSQTPMFARLCRSGRSPPYSHVASSGMRLAPRCTLEDAVKESRNLWRIRVDPSTLDWISAERLTTAPGRDVALVCRGMEPESRLPSQHETSRHLGVSPRGEVGRAAGEGKPRDCRGRALHSPPCRQTAAGWRVRSVASPAARDSSILTISTARSSKELGDGDRRTRVEHATGRSSPTVRLEGTPPEMGPRRAPIRRYRTLRRRLGAPSLCWSNRLDRGRPRYPRPVHGSAVHWHSEARGCDPSTPRGPTVSSSRIRSGSLGKPRSRPTRNGSLSVPGCGETRRPKHLAIAPAEGRLSSERWRWPPMMHRPTSHDGDPMAASCITSPPLGRRSTTSGASDSIRRWGVSWASLFRVTTFDSPATIIWPNTEDTELGISAHRAIAQRGLGDRQHLDAR